MRPVLPFRAPALILLLLPASALTACGETTGGPEAAPSPDDARQALLARAEAHELDTEYVPPPGDPLEHHTAGFAKTLCSNVFLTGLDPAFAAEHTGYFSAPYEERRHVTDTVVDFENRAVHLTLPSGVTRTAKVYGRQGCVALPIGADSVRFTPRTRSGWPGRWRRPSIPRRP
jgi:hypothetical protein